MITRKVIKKLGIAGYVSAKQIDEVYKKNSEGIFGALQGGIMATGFKMNQGFKQAKIDIKHFYLSSKDSYIPEENGQNRLIMLKKRYETKADLWKLPILGSLFMLPLGIPIIILYMHFFPAIVSSWFVTDVEHEKDLAQRKLKSVEALQYFLSCGSIQILEASASSQNTECTKRQIVTWITLSVFNNMALQQQKILADLLFGVAKDGTVLVGKTFKLKFQYLIDPRISSWILCNDLQERLEFQEGIDPKADEDALTQTIKKKVGEMLHLV